MTKLLRRVRQFSKRCEDLQSVSSLESMTFYFGFFCSLNTKKGGQEIYS